MNEKTNVKKGLLIVLCGGEGSGKSSVISAIQMALPDILITREPGGKGAPYAEDIRTNMFSNPRAKDANAETMFGQAWASRAEHIDKFVRSTLAEGKNIVSDRFDCCTYAYQICAQNGSHLKELFWQTRKVYLRSVAPSLYILLDVKPEIGLKRVAGRPGKKTHFDEQDIAFHDAVHEGYLEFFENLDKVSHQNSGYRIIDASNSLDQVTSDVLGIIKDVIK